MLRRKKKAARPPRESRPPRDTHAAHDTPAPRSRRRARPDAVVPRELLLHESPSPEPAKGRDLKRSPEPVAPLGPTPSPKTRRNPGREPARPDANREPARPGAQREPAPPGADREPTRRPRPGGTQRVILVTGFEPFGGEALNPSWEICKRLPREIAGRRVETLLVPCEFRTAIEVVAEAIEQHGPEIVVSLGQAGGRSQVGVERVAINVDDARAPDNAGQQPIDEPVAENGPPAYFSTLPVKAMVAAMRAANVPAELSNSAGTYVCNHLMYGVLHFAAASGNAARAGFIHVPYAEEQVLDRRGVPGMAVATMVRGVEAALAAACEHRRDIAIAEGTLD
jgi:pyroglutamyl-peptidase